MAFLKSGSGRGEALWVASLVLVAPPAMLRGEHLHQETSVAGVALADALP